MYTGTMIEDLIQAVAHAEEQARTQDPTPFTVWVAPAPPPQPAILHARADSYIGQMVGVA
jgi:hypothetical protein